MGFQIVAIDIADDKLALAKQLGADVTVNAKNGDVVEAVKKATSGGAHGVLITAPLFDVVAECITIRGSFVGTRQDMAEALAFAADGRVVLDFAKAPPASKSVSAEQRVPVAG